VRIVVVGGTGQVGSKLVKTLIADGHEAVAAAPSTGVDPLSGEGLAEALAGAAVVVDVSNSPSTDDDAAMEFFRRSTTRLLEAEAAARVGHHVVLSVVGTDRLAPQSGYSRAKSAQEELVAEGPIPYTIVRATQFFEFLRTVADAATVDATVRLPAVLIRPMAAVDVARALAAATLGEPRNGLVEVGGPREYLLPELIRTGLTARGDARQVIADPAATYLGLAVDERTLLPGEGAVAYDVRFEDWIIETAAKG
jgi:uncharacterized protein YbjT (DUF2867 family)